MDRRMRPVIGILAMLLLIPFGISPAQAQNHKSLNHTDKKFVEDAYKDGLAAVSMGEVAATRTHNPAVRDFADRMVQDHEAANRELMQLSQKEGASLPKDMGSSYRNRIEKLSSMKRQDFDRAYMEQEVKDHKSDLKEYSKEVNDGANPALKSFASRTIPKLEHHLSMASTIDQKIGGSKA